MRYLVHPISFANNDMEQEIYPANATLIERIMAYMEYGLVEEAETLAMLGDRLEECFACDIYWE